MLRLQAVGKGSLKLGREIKASKGIPDLGIVGTFAVVHEADASVRPFAARVAKA
jgi:hypothetical protein